MSAPDSDPHIPSLVSVYPTNDWHERETYDFFGIVFDGHPALTRIMMPDDWHGPPAAQGLPARRHPGRVQGRADPGSGPAEVVQLMTTSNGTSHASARETTEGPVYTVTGGDWDEVVQSAAEADDERIVVNMGPQHPSTHGVLRLILELEGETVTEARCGIGYLHTGIEKNLEYRTWTQGITFVTRMDYLTPFFNETAYCLGVEKLLGITDQIPDRATVIRVLLMELNRLSSHLVCDRHRRHGARRDHDHDLRLP